MNTNLATTYLELCLIIEYRIIALPEPARGPSYNSAGEPAQDLEYDVERLSLSLNGETVELPPNLTNLFLTAFAGEINSAILDDFYGSEIFPESFRDG